MSDDARRLFREELQAIQDEFDQVRRMLDQERAALIEADLACERMSVELRARALELEAATWPAAPRATGRALAPPAPA